MNEQSDLDDYDISDLASNTRNKISQRRTNANESNRPSLVTNKYPERDDIIYRHKMPTTRVDDRNVTKKVKVGYQKNRSIFVIGDSLLKNMEAHKIRNGLDSDDRIYVKCFPGSSISDMQSYIVPSKKFNNDLVICHIGTNSLRDAKKLDELAITSDN